MSGMTLTWLIPVGATRAVKRVGRLSISRGWAATSRQCLPGICPGERVTCPFNSYETNLANRWES
jgi:hypothetical protein